MSPTLQSINGVQVATLTGSLNNSTGSDLVTLIKTSVPKDSPVVLDFDLVDSMDGQGLRHLLVLNQWFEQNGGRLVLAGMTPVVWAEVQKANCTEKIETSVSRGLALKVLGGNFASPQPTDMPSHSATAEPSADDFGGFDSGTGNTPEVDSGIFSRPPPIADIPQDDWSAPPPAPIPETPASGWDENQGWSRFDRATSREEKPNVRKSKPGKWLFVALAGAGTVALVLAAFWLVAFLKVPVIEVDAHFLEAHEGQELAGTEIWVRHGQLNTTDIELPPGIDLAEGEESDEGWRYYLGGIAKIPGSYTISLTASRGSRAAVPVDISLDIAEKKMSWVYSQPPLTENVAITKTQYTRIVIGAQSLTLNWAGDTAEGLIVEESEEASGTWRLSGTPTKSGTFRAEFLAKSNTGKEETKNYLINVRPAPAPPPVVVVAAPLVEPIPTLNTKVNTPDPVADDPVPDVQGVDDRMRTFLMERIEKANNHFTDEDKSLLRVIVSRLQEARLVATVGFGNSQTKPDSEDARELIEELNKPETKKLMQNPDCQVLVVGYASTTGSKSINLKLSRLRAKAVNDLLRGEIGRSADLCGDYGPTDIISTEESGNRAVEVYAGTINVGKAEQPLADMFKKDFNKRHGAN